MIKEIEDLAKAIDLGQQMAEILKKSQMSLFGDPHHVGYERTSSSGTVSHIQAKGSTNPYNTDWKGKKEKLGDATQAIIGKRYISAVQLHEINGTHDGATGALIHKGNKYEAVKHKGNWHLTGNYTTNDLEANEAHPQSKGAK